MYQNVPRPLETPIFSTSSFLNLYALYKEKSW